ncbi:MAG: tetratricopeptide repeat protein, partial [Anaerolineales bacterium]
MAAMKRRWILLLPAALAAAGLACQLPTLAELSPTSTPTMTATPTATSTPTPTPTPLPETYFEEAEHALFVGDWSAAMEAFQRAASQSADPEVQGAAHLGIGSTHLRAGRNPEAEQALSEYLERFPEHSRRGEGHFLRAVAYEQQEQAADALTDYRRYLELHPDAIDYYVQETIGDLLRDLDRPVDAVDSYRAAIAAEPMDGPISLEIKIGLAYYEAEDYESALSQFDRVFEAAQDGPTKATANLLAGRTLVEMGQSEAAYERYLDSVNRFPTAYDSYLGLIDLVEADVPVDLFQRGLVDYYAGAYEPALRAFNRAEPNTPSAELYYLRGMTLRSLGNYPGAAADFSVVISQYPESERWDDAWFERAQTEWVYQDQLSSALETYLEFQRAAPEHSRAAEALYQAGRVAERMDELDQAADIFKSSADQYPASNYAYSSAFSAGILRYRQDQFELAAAAFEQAEGMTGSSEAASGARYWLGKTFAARDQLNEAKAIWQMAAEMDPTGYYAGRAQDQLTGLEPFEPTGIFSFNDDLESQRSEAETWLREQFVIDGPEPLTQLDPELAADPRAIRGEAFWRLGLYGEAKEQFESLRASHAEDAEATYRLMHKLLDLGLYQPAIFAARNVLDLAGLDDAGTLEAPRYFNTIRFGSYYGDLIVPAAAEHDLDALLVFSVVRQESLFEGFATSYAAARGLMQVIPATGQEIADQLGWPPGYETIDLYRPVVSVRFGSHYLAQQRDRFNGEMVAALAAYN